MSVNALDVLHRAFVRSMEHIRVIRPIYAVTLIAAVAAQCALTYFDAFDKFYEFSRAHENWQLDEWFTSLSVLSVVLLAALIVRSRDLKREVERRAAAEAQIDIALTNMRQGLSMFDAEQRLVMCNDRFVSMYGLPAKLTAPGTPLQQILQYCDADPFAKGVVPAHSLHELPSDIAEGLESVAIGKLKDGRTISVAHQGLSNGGWVSTHEDITERRHIEERISHMAHHDALTDLPNRAMLCQLLEDMVARVRRGECLAVLYLDLDRFKEINDTLGHAVGDALLKAVAARISRCVRETDTVARMGGDEFAVVVPTIDPAVESTALAARIIESISAPFELSRHRVTIGTSIGIALSPNDGVDPDQLLRNADLALCRAKSDGRGTLRFFELEMDQRMQARRAMERDLRKAITDGEFELYYQPIVSLARDCVTGFEALLRWNHPERGRVSPADFIPIAEETGLIVPIGEWVLRRACMEAVSWPKNLTIAVNLSVAQFKSKRLVDAVGEAIRAAGLCPSRLELEITETVLMQDTDAALSVLGKLREIGIRIALDDFGTGYSSLSYLRRFPFDKIKIDRCFISDLTDKADESLALLRMIANLGLSLGIATTAEGVETKEQLDVVRAEGCAEVQGYYFSAPKPASEIAKYFLEPALAANAA
jgi:diguanylate cyclase (GGDEF)-like protein